MSPRPLPGQAVPHITPDNRGSRRTTPLEQVLPPTCPSHPAPSGTPPPGGAAAVPGYFTGFQTPQSRVVNCPSDARIVTVISCADVAKLLSMMSPPLVVRSQ